MQTPKAVSVMTAMFEKQTLEKEIVHSTIKIVIKRCMAMLKDASTWGSFPIFQLPVQRMTIDDTMKGIWQRCREKKTDLPFLQLITSIFRCRTSRQNRVFAQPRSQSGSTLRASPRTLGSKPPALTRIARIGLGTRLVFAQFLPQLTVSCNSTRGASKFCCC